MGDPLIWTRAIHYAATVTAAGGAAFLCLIAEPAFRQAGCQGGPVFAGLRRRLLLLISIGLAIAVLSGAAWLALEGSAMSGRPLAQVFAGGILETVLARTHFGHVTTIRLGLAVLLAAALASMAAGRPAAARPWRRLLLLGTAGGFIGTLAWIGHAAATDDRAGTIHLGADIAHLLAAGAWLGGLVPLAMLYARARRQEDVPRAVAAVATRRFSVLGIVAVASLLATGLVHTWFLVGSLSGLIGTSYGRLLLVKLGLLVAMVAIAAVNLLRLTPRLERLSRGRRSGESHDPLGQLRRNSLIEAGLGLAILAIVAVLGQLPPALHVEPSWPLAFRFSAEALQAPELRFEVLTAIAVTAIGILLIVIGIPQRRARWPMLLAGAIFLLYGAPSLKLLTVEAFPTSFYASPAGFTVASILRGQQLFAARCVSCHGSGGIGDGPAGKDLAVLPADLTADHIYDHPDGDLFWWIGNGIDHVMPGFAGTLDDEARWNLIDFVHANADATRLADLVEDPGNALLAAPDFAVECPGSAATSLRNLEPRIVHLVFAGSGTPARLGALAARGLGDDVATVLVPSEAARDTARFCAARDPQIRVAYALYLKGRGCDIAGAEFLVDPGGRLRASWCPGREPDWSDPKVLDATVERLRRLPVGASVPRPHLHVH